MISSSPQFSFSQRILSFICLLGIFTFISWVSYSYGSGSIFTHGQSIKYPYPFTPDTHTSYKMILNSTNSTDIHIDLPIGIKNLNPEAERIAIKSFPKFIILSMGDIKSTMQYADHLASISCYAYKHGYKHIIIKNIPEYHLETQEAKDFCFSFPHYSQWDLMKKRVCVFYDIFVKFSSLNNHPYEWIVPMDMDVFTVNSLRRLDEFISPKDISPSLSSSIDMVFYPRFQTGEIAAGIFLMKLRSLYAKNVIQKFIGDFERYWNKIGNQDNGILLFTIIRLLHGDKSPLLKECEKIAFSIAPFHHIPHIIKCIECGLGIQRFYPEKHILFHRRGQFAVRDFFVSAPPNSKNKVGHVDKTFDLFFHGWKKSLRNVWYSKVPSFPKCTHDNNDYDNTNINESIDSNWSVPLIPSLVSPPEIIQNFIRKMGDSVKTWEVGVPFNDISHCWPNCNSTSFLDGQIDKKGLRAFFDDVCPVKFKKTKSFQTQFKELIYGD